MKTSSANAADDADRRMAFHKVASVPLCCSTSIQMTSQFIPTQGVSCTPMTCATPYRSNHLGRWKRPLVTLGKLLAYSHKPVYLGATLDRSFTYTYHMAKTKANPGARNRTFKKLANSHWGTDVITIRSTTLALRFSFAEYASPVCNRSSHASKIDQVLNHACRPISICIRPTKIDNLYLLGGIAPPTYQTGSIIPA